MRTLALALTGAALLAATQAGAASPTAAAQVFAESNDRGADLAANPDYLQRYAADVQNVLVGTEHPERVNTDPFVWDAVVAPGSGVQAVSWRNRYGVRISGHLWRPVASTGPSPAVVLEPGFRGTENGLWGLALTLQRAGYVVLSFDPQAQGLSDTTPAPQYCRPGPWQDPQEGGLRERGTCAGVPADPPPAHQTVPDPPAGPAVGTALAARTGESDPGDRSASYEYWRPTFVFGVLDAVRWLLSADDPARAQVDRARVAAVGHSAGGDGALVAAGVDPLHRFRAAVSLDSNGVPPASWSPRVPTLQQQSEREGEYGPYAPAPGPDFFPSRRTDARLRASGTPSALVALRASSHLDWLYAPVSPNSLGQTSQSRYGERLGAYYTQAWLDRWLRGDRAGTDRLLACTYDGSVDAASVGAGRYDPLTGGNTPYRIVGLPAEQGLSPLVTSSVSLDGRRLDDVLGACLSRS